jgi:hypothetical protein
LPVAVVDFGNVTQGGNYTNLTGIQIQNDGSLRINVEINSTDLFLGTHAWPGSSYQFKVGAANEGGPEEGTFDVKSLMTWAFMSNARQTAIFDLGIDDLHDIAAFHFNVSVPIDEPAGVRESVITLTANSAE